MRKKRKKKKKKKRGGGLKFAEGEVWKKRVEIGNEKEGKKKKKKKKKERGEGVCAREKKKIDKQEIRKKKIES